MLRTIESAASSWRVLLTHAVPYVSCTCSRPAVSGGSFYLYVVRASAYVATTVCKRSCPETMQKYSCCALFVLRVCTHSNQLDELRRSSSILAVCKRAQSTANWYVRISPTSKASSRSLRRGAYRPGRSNALTASILRKLS